VRVGSLRERAPPRLATRRLDLDDVGAEPREHLGAARPRFVLREVEDDDPVERLAHVASIVAGTASPARTVGGLPQVRGDRQPGSHRGWPASGARGPPARLAPWVACLRCGWLRIRKRRARPRSYVVYAE